MKKLLLHPRIEIIFSLSLIAILGLPPLVLAQKAKSIEIKIINGDTTINGKDIKQLSAQERKYALGEIDKAGNITFKQTDKDGRSNIVIRRNRTLRNPNKKDDGTKLRMFGNDNNDSSPYTLEFDNNDTATRRVMRYRFKRPNGSDSTFAFNMEDGPRIRFDNRQFNLDDDRPMRMERQFRFDGPGRGERMIAFNRKNTQTFSYSNTDNNGISTDISFRVTDAGNGPKKNADTDKAVLILNDLSLSPEFSTGKTLLSFNLPAKTATEVKLTDSEGKVLLTDKATAGSFSKKVTLPLNGIYYLTVKQGANVAVKKIVKEQ